jgi:hypothetical protein
MLVGLELIADQCSEATASGIKAHVLHADDFLAFILTQGVPDRHVVGR